MQRRPARPLACRAALHLPRPFGPNPQPGDNSSCLPVSIESARVFHVSGRTLDQMNNAGGGDYTGVLVRFRECAV